MFDAIVSRGSFTEDASKQVMCTVFEALVFIHARGGIRRDVKPESIRSDPVIGRVRLAGFR